MTTMNDSNTQNFTFCPNNRLSCYRNKVLLFNLVLLILISVSTILGNTLVLVATWVEKSLHEPNKYFIAFLAVADLLVGIITVPLVFYRHLIQLTEGDFLPNQGLACFAAWIDILTATVSIYTLTFISIDRYLKISKPLHYRSRMTTSTSLKIMFIVFLISILYATFSICPERGGIFRSNKGYFTFGAVAAFFLPTIVMLIMYALIFLVAHKRQKMLRNGELGQTFDDRNQRTVFHKDLKLIRMFAIIVGVFIVCWGPLFIWVMLSYYNPQLIYSKERKFVLTMKTTIWLLPPMNSLCNPIIYGCLDQKYKKAFKHLLQKLMRQPIPSRQKPINAIRLQNLNQPTTSKAKMCNVD